MNKNTDSWVEKDGKRGVFIDGVFTPFDQRRIMKKGKLQPSPSNQEKILDSFWQISNLAADAQDQDPFTSESVTILRSKLTQIQEYCDTLENLL